MKRTCDFISPLPPPKYQRVENFFDLPSLINYIRNSGQVPECIPILEKINKRTGVSSVKYLITKLVYYYLKTSVDGSSPIIPSEYSILLTGKHGTGKSMLASLIKSLYTSLGIKTRISIYEGDRPTPTELKMGEIVLITAEEYTFYSNVCWHLHLDDYTNRELVEMLVFILLEEGWSFIGNADKLLLPETVTRQGHDIASLASISKIVHVSRTFPYTFSRDITTDDMEEAIMVHKKNMGKCDLRYDSMFS